MHTTNNKQVFNCLIPRVYGHALVWIFLLYLTLSPENSAFGQNKIDIIQADTLNIAANNHFSTLVEDAETAWKTNDTKRAEILTLNAFEKYVKGAIQDSNYAKLLHTYGKLLIDKQLNGSGIDSLLKSIRIKTMLYGDKHISLSKTYNYIGIGYFQMRNYKNANKYYKLSANILLNNNIWGPELFDAFLNIGIVEAVQGKYDKAYFYFDTTQMVLDSVRNQIDSLYIARFYSNYGLLATLNGRLEEGNRYFNSSEIIYQKIKGDYSTSIANINSNKGINAFFNFDFDRSQLYYKRALQAYIENDEDTRTVGVYINLSAVSIKSGHFNEAIQFINLGLEHDPDDELKWLFYSNLTQAYIALNDFEKATYYFNEAIDLQEQGKINPIKKINLFIEFANFMLVTDNFFESKIYYDEALELIENSMGQNSDAYANILSKLGNYYLALSSVDSSLFYFNWSIQVWDKYMNSGDLNKTILSETKYAEAYIGRANTLYKKYSITNNPEHLENGCQDMKMILDRMEQVVSKLDKESKLLLYEQLEPAYSLAIDMTYEQNRLSNNAYMQQLFDFMERSKSSVLLASVRNLDALKSTDVPEYIMQLEKQLNEEINGIRQLLADEQQKRQPAPDKILFFETKLLQLLNAHDSLTYKLEKQYPRYYALKYNRSTIQLPDLLANLNDNEVMVEYELTDTAVYLYTISRGGLKVTKVSIDSLFWRSLDYLLTVKNVDIAAFKRKEIITFYEHSHNIWRHLIEPIHDQIDSKKLIIIPDGILGYLPFDILASKYDKEEEMSFKSIPYLLYESPVSYSYSATLKYNPYFTKNGENNNELIAFAPDYEQENKDDVQKRNQSFVNLPNAKKEVESIEEMWKGNLFLDKKATKSNFIKKAGDYDIIHLAMHTLINDSVPMFSKLVFAEEDGDTTSGFLNTYEIYDLNLSASMVTLSACNTGTGIYRSGEGIMSLARGFIYAGAPSIVMSLWEVQDKSGSEIMTRYYEYLKLGDAKDVALQKAKLDFLMESPDYSTHPFYWSAFIMTGNTEAFVNMKRPIINSTLISIGIICFILVFWVIKKKNKKRSGKTV